MTFKDNTVFLNKKESDIYWNNDSFDIYRIMILYDFVYKNRGEDSIKKNTRIADVAGDTLDIIQGDWMKKYRSYFYARNLY